MSIKVAANKMHADLDIGVQTLKKNSMDMQSCKSFLFCATAPTLVCLCCYLIFQWSEGLLAVVN
jgi:hypothetical protein